MVDSSLQREEVLKTADDCSEQLVDASNKVVTMATVVTATFAACKLGRQRLFVLSYR